MDESSDLSQLAVVCCSVIDAGASHDSNSAELSCMELGALSHILRDAVASRSLVGLLPGSQGTLRYRGGTSQGLVSAGGRLGEIFANF
jgi:hypothetical protein